MERLQPKLRFPDFERNWEKVKLKDVSSYFNGGSFENDVKEKGRYELITLKSIDISGNLVHSKRYLDISVPTLKKGSLVMILSEQSPGLLGMTAVIPIDNKFVLNQRVAEIRPRNEVASYFLSMTINRNQNYFSKHGAGTKVQNISKPNVENFSFLLPLYPEQTKIANFLTSVDEKLNLLIQKKEALEEYKKGMMQKIFSQEIRFKDDNGEDFEDWEEKRLGEIGDIITGKTPQTSKKELWNGTIQFVTPTDITNKKYQTTTIRTVNQNVKARILPSKTIMFTCIASIGKMSLSTLPCITNQQINALIPNSDFDNEFIYYSILNMTEYIKSTQSNTTLPIINKTDFSKFSLKIPSKNEQSKIANFLSSIDDKIELVSTQIEATKDYKKGLLQGMFC